MKKLVILFLAIGLFSCEKDIEFELDETPELLVVDAQIENGLPPRVVLTTSFSYFSTINLSLLSSLFVHDAEITISNGTKTHRLKEDSIALLPGTYAYFYGLDSSNLSTAFVGEFNTTYQLKIISAGKEYLASTTIPELATKPDSIYFKQPPFLNDTTLRTMMVKVTDPPGIGNYVRYFTRTNNGIFLPGENSVYSDEVIDGTTYNVAFPKGIDRNDPPKPDSNFYKVGEIVTFKFCNINKSTYTFWNTWEFAYQSIGNPFAQPNKVIGNISNGALGAFCGYAAWYATEIVK